MLLMKDNCPECNRSSKNMTLMGIKYDPSEDEKEKFPEICASHGNERLLCPCGMILTWFDMQTCEVRLLDGATLSKNYLWMVEKLKTHPKPEPGDIKLGDIPMPNRQQLRCVTKKISFLRRILTWLKQ